MSADDCTLYCSNLSEKVTERILYELFMQAGPVKDVRIPMSNGKPRSFGFVVFKHECSVMYAARLMENTMLYGKCLSLRPAKGSNHRMERPNQERLEFPDSSSLRGLGRDIRKRPQDNDMMPTNLGKRLCENPDPMNILLNPAPLAFMPMFIPGMPSNNFPFMNHIPSIQYPSQNTQFNGSVKYCDDQKYYDRDRGRDRNNDRPFRKDDRYNDFERDKHYKEKNLYREERNHNRERSRYDKRHNEMNSRGRDRHVDKIYNHRSHRR